MGALTSKERKKGDKLRAKVLERDGYMCRICGSNENLEVHHMLALTFGGKSTMKNLITLCADCHFYAPEDGIESNKEYLRKRNKVIYEHLITFPESFAVMTVAYMEFIKQRAAKYVELGFITEEQKEAILEFEEKKIFQEGTNMKVTIVNKPSAETEKKVFQYLARILSQKQNERKGA